ncbi:DUF2064 domain-containing protein [Gracilimonas sp.]|uniref:TIGR04282 family arsenosugar biosynthesis glycosyltransferase n=1 Tax=Gracilimonas sp. TaxID=1974203 RepID=UPI0028718EBF|nr:DUF2064 domain-containing protein [Gracilimonas sp.]
MIKEVSSHTAIIYFSLTPWQEAQGKSFIAGASFQKNLRIARLLWNHSKSQIEKSGIPYFLFDEHNQKGETFGGKFVSAFEAVFSQGFDHVIAVGNDTPRLQSQHILEAAEKLEQGASEVVLGPATDGGTWLMCFSQKAFNPELIENLAWTSGDLLNSIFEELGSSQKISLLEQFDDVDNEQDLKKFLEISENEEFLLSLKKNIQSIIEHVLFVFYAFQIPYKDFDLSYHFLLRAPPSTSDSFLQK